MTDVHAPGEDGTSRACGHGKRDDTETRRGCNVSRASDGGSDRPVPVFRISYDGSRFMGSQAQPCGKTVQDAVERAAAALVPEPGGRVLFSGRTDRGVHATGQVIAFPAGLKAPPAAAARAMNGRLPPWVRLTAWTEGAPGFHPRFDAVQRVYIYILRPGTTGLPFQASYSWPVPGEVDWRAVAAAAGLFEGEHDFTCFATAPSSQARLVRRLDSCRVSMVRGDKVLLEFRARAFLRGQVRNMVGALIAVGAGDLELEELAGLFHAGPKRNERIPRPAPASGLYLREVIYPEGRLLSDFRPCAGFENIQKDLDRFFGA